MLKCCEGWKRDETICKIDKLELATADDPLKKVMCKAIDWMGKKEANQDGELERCTDEDAERSHQWHKGNEMKKRDGEKSCLWG